MVWESVQERLDLARSSFPEKNDLGLDSWM